MSFVIRPVSTPSLRKSKEIKQNYLVIRKTMNETTSIDDTSNEEGGQSYFNVFSTIYLAFVVVVGSTLNTQALFLLRDATKVS